jgi:hypothetical protein
VPFLARKGQYNPKRDKNAKNGAKLTEKMLLFWVEILAYLVTSHVFVN